MAYLNKVMLIGNIGKDPEVRVSQASGRKRVSFSLATSRRYRDNNGEQKEDTQWHNIVGWGKSADIFEQLGISKGTAIYVEGSLTNRSWNDQNSQKRYVTEVNMESFQVLTPRNPQPNHYATQEQQTAGATKNAFGSMHDYSDEDPDDLPF